MTPAGGEFDPRAPLAALEATYVDYVLIGGLAQVLRGVDVTTRGAAAWMCARRLAGAIWSA